MISTGFKTVPTNTATQSGESASIRTETNQVLAHGPHHTDYKKHPGQRSTTQRLRHLCGACGNAQCHLTDARYLKRANFVEIGHACQPDLNDTTTHDAFSKTSY